MISVRARLHLVALLALGAKERTHSEILSVEIEGGMTCTSFGDFINKYNCSYLQANINRTIARAHEVSTMINILPHTVLSKDSVFNKC